MLLDQMIAKIYKSIPNRRKKVFLFSIFWGVVSHIYILTNLLYNHDGVVNMYIDTDALTSGRWLLKYATSLSGPMQTPSVIVLFSLVFLACLNCGIIESFEIKSSLHMFVVSGLVITFPTVVCTFSYLFTADAYFLSALLAVLAVYAAKKLDKGWIISVLFLACSMGIYQAYFSYASGMFAAMILCMLLDTDLAWDHVLKEGLKYVFVLLAGIGLYYVLLQLCLKLNHTALSAYRSIDQMGKYKLHEIPSLLAVTFQEMIVFYFVKGTYSWVPDLLVTVNRIIGCIMAVMFAWLSYRKKVYKNVARLLLCVLVMILFPLAVNFMQIANPQEKPHVLMIFSYVIFYILFLKLTELTIQEIKTNFLQVAVMFFCNLLCAVVLYRGYLLTNEGYLRLQLTYESTYAFANRLVASIENNGNYDSNIPVWISGNFNYTAYPFKREAFSEMTDLTGIFSDYITYSDVQLKHFLDHTLNIRYTEPQLQFVDVIKGSEEYRNMSCYPYENSIRMIDGVLVVKLSDVSGS